MRKTLKDTNEFKEMKIFDWIKGIFMYTDTIDRLKDSEERIRKLEIENSAVQTSLRIIEGSLDIKIKNNENDKPNTRRTK